MTKIGSVERVESREFVFLWKVEKFSSLQDECYSSPYFHFCGRRWYLLLFPKDLSGSRISLQLWPKSAAPPLRVRYSLGVAKAGGGEEVCKEATETFGDRFRYVPGAGIGKSELSRRREELLPGDLLTVTVTIMAEAERGVEDASVQATVECHVTDASVQTEVEESATGGGEGEPSANADFEKLREHFRLWLEHPEEGERIRRLRMEELEKREKREKVVKKQPPPEKGPIFYAA